MFRASYTFILYLCVFIPALFFTNCVDQYSQKRHALNRFLIVGICSILAIGIPTIFAGFRGIDVGTDIKVYAVPEYELSQLCTGLKDYLDTTKTNIGYAFIVWFSANIMHSFNVLLIITELLQVGPIFLTAYVSRKHIPMWQVMFVFFFMHYVIGFNVMRQSISAAFLLLAYVLYKEKYYKTTIICIIIAQLFHSTAILGCLIVGTVIVVISIKNRCLKWTILCMLPLMTAIFLLFWDTWITIILNSGLLPADKFQIYLDVFSGKVQGPKSYMFEVEPTQYVEIALKVVYLFFPTLYTFKYRWWDRLHKELFLFTLVGVLINVMVLIVLHSAYGYRLAMYLEYFFILYIPYSCNNQMHWMKKKYDDTFKVSTSILWNILVLLSSFFLLYMLWGHQETLPFYFEIYFK